MLSFRTSVLQGREQVSECLRHTTGSLQLKLAHDVLHASI